MKNLKLKKYLSPGMPMAALGVALMVIGIWLMPETIQAHGFPVAAKLLATGFMMFLIGIIGEAAAPLSLPVSAGVVPDVPGRADPVSIEKIEISMRCGQKFESIELVLHCYLTNGRRELIGLPLDDPKYAELVNDCHRLKELQGARENNTQKRN